MSSILGHIFFVLRIPILFFCGRSQWTFYRNSSKYKHLKKSVWRVFLFKISLYRSLRSSNWITRRKWRNQGLRKISEQFIWKWLSLKELTNLRSAKSENLHLQFRDLNICRKRISLNNIVMFHKSRFEGFFFLSLKLGRNKMERKSFFSFFKVTSLFECL